jgi:hypothetical protein
MRYEQVQRENRRLLNAGARGLDDGATDVAVAAHEGAHVVVASLVGFGPVYATIDPGLGSDGLTTFGKGAISEKMDREWAFNHAVVRLAGPEGERLAGKDDPDAGAKDDLVQARRAVGLYCRTAEVDIEIGRARRQARQMLLKEFAALLAITSALLEKRSINEDEIEQLLSSSMPDADDGDDEVEEIRRRMEARQRSLLGSDSIDDDDDDDDGSLRAILPTITGTVLHGALEAIPTRQCHRELLVFYGEAR